MVLSKYFRDYGDEISFEALLKGMSQLLKSHSQSRQVPKSGFHLILRALALQVKGCCGFEAEETLPRYYCYQET